jgi:hypothetical protein
MGFSPRASRRPDLRWNEVISAARTDASRVSVGSKGDYVTAPAPVNARQWTSSAKPLPGV